MLLILCRLMQLEHYLENIFEVCMLFNFTALQFYVFRITHDQLGHYLEGLQLCIVHCLSLLLLFVVVLCTYLD